VPGVPPDLGELPQMLPVTTDDERPALLVLRAVGAPARAKDPIQVFVLEWTARETSDDASR